MRTLIFTYATVKCNIVFGMNLFRFCKLQLLIQTIDKLLFTMINTDSFYLKATRVFLAFGGSSIHTAALRRP